MLSLLVSLAASAVTYGIVFLVFWNWYAPIPPSMLVAGGTFYLLNRMWSKKVQAHVESLVPLLQAQKIKEADELLVDVKRRYAKWVFLLAGQMDFQRGMIMYMQMKWDKAAELIDKGKWRNWQAHTALGAMRYRKGDKAAAWEHFAKAGKAASKEAMVYLIWATLAVRANERDRALEALKEGLGNNPGSQHLKNLQRVVANKKKIDVKQFPQMWYQFFPEDMMRQYAVRGRKGKQTLPDGMQVRHQQGPPQRRIRGGKKSRR